MKEIRRSNIRNSLFPYSINEWNKLSTDICNSKSLSSFKTSIRAFIIPSSSSVFSVYNPHGLKLLTRLRLSLSHLRYHKFRHNFLDTLNPLCSCDLLEAKVPGIISYVTPCFHNIENLS